MNAVSITPIGRKPEAELVDVTPELATEWLGHNDRNRNVRDSKVSTYASAMAAGDWMVTGDGPKFDVSGRLINGQHTLKAVVESGKTVRMFVFRNMHPESQLVMDMGAKRSIADALKFAGVSGCNLNMLAAMARIGVYWEEGHYRRSGQSNAGREVTSLETIEWVERNKDAIDATSAADLIRRRLPIPASVLAFSVMQLSRIDADETHRFFSLASNFQTSGKGDPIFTLLKRYQAASQGKETLRAPQHLALIFRTWNAWRKGEKLFYLKIGNVSTGSGELSAISIPQPE